MKITRLKRHPRLDRVRVYVDDERKPECELALDLVLRHGLAVGDRVSAELLSDLEQEDQGFRARDAALSLLSHRPRSREELRRRLRRKEFDGAIIEETVAWLEERGYVDDYAFAEAYVRDRLRLRPRGRFGLLRELRKKGVAQDVAGRAIDGVMGDEEVDETSLARETAEAWRRKNRRALDRARGDRDQQRKVRNRLYGHLARRGFAPDAVRVAMTVLDD